MRRQSLGILAILAACQGCADDWRAETHPASGRVTVNGQPPAGAIIQLHSVNGKTDARNSRPWAIVQDDGTYSLSTYRQGDGIPPGEYAFTIRWPWDPTKPSPEDRLDHAYENPAKSPWKVTIAEGENAIPPVEIAGAKVLDKPNPRRRRVEP